MEVNIILKFCPRCGHPISSSDTFCQNCGYQLSKSENQPDSNPNLRKNYSNQEIPNSEFRKPPKRGLSIFKIIAIFVIVVMVTAIGLYTAHNFNVMSLPKMAIEHVINHHLTPRLGNNSTSTPASSSTSNSSQSSAAPNKINDHIQDLWSNVDHDLKSGSDDLSSDPDITQLFSGGDDNTAFNGLNDWFNEVSHANDHNDTKVSGIHAYDVKVSQNGNGETVANYKVRYNFRLNRGVHSGENHIQVFDWQATINSDGKVKHMTSPHTPASDYFEAD